MTIDKTSIMLYKTQINYKNLLNFKFITNNKVKTLFKF